MALLNMALRGHWGRLQTQVLEAIADYVREHDLPPTVREVCRSGLVGLSH